MTLTDIAMQNLRRRKGKTIFMGLIFLLIAGTTVTLSSLAADMQASLRESLAKYGANIIITPHSNHFDLSYGGIAVPGVNFNVQRLNYDLPSQIQAAGADVSGIAPKIIGMAQGQDRRFLIVGVDFPSELKMKPWWRVKGNLPQAHQVIVGAAIATDNKLSIGTTLKLNGQLYPVTGIMQETGGSEDNAVFVDFGTAQSLTGIGNAWSMVEVNSSDPDAATARLSSLFPQAKVAEVSQLVQGNKESVNRFTGYAIFTSILLGVIGLLIVMLTMAGSVNERTAELGIFRAIGFRRRHVSSLLLREITIISLSGSVLGYLLGIIASPLLGPLLFHKSFSFHFYLSTGLLVVICAGLGGVLSTIYPLRRVLRLEPLDALRFI